MEKKIKSKNSKARSEMLYKTFLYFLEPYWLDERGADIRGKTRKALSISESQENLLIEKLKKEGIIEEVGNAIFIKDKTSMKKYINQLIKTRRFNMDKFFKNFINHG